MQLVLPILLLCAGLASAEEIRVLTWNVESDRPEGAGHFADGNTPATIAGTRSENDQGS